MTQTYNDIPGRMPRFLRLRSLILVLSGIAAVLSFTIISRQPLTPTLDNSWMAVITYAAAKPLQFGSEIIFNYGPLGHLVASTYSPELFLPELAARIAINSLYVAMIFSLAARLPLIRRLVFIFFALLTAFADWQAMLLFMIVAAAFLAFGSPPANKVLLVLAVAFLAVVSLIKATFLFFALFVMLGGLVHLGVRREVRRALIIFLFFVAVFLVAWALPGQKIINIPSYLWSSFEIARSYSAAMSLPPPRLILAGGLVVVILLLVQLALALIRNGEEKTTPFMSLVLFAGLFLAWKLGYTRADAHVAELFYYAIVVVLALPAFHPRPPRGTEVILDWVIVAIVVTCGLLVIRDQTDNTPWKLCRFMPQRLPENLSSVTHLKRTRRQIEETLRLDAEASDLTESRKLIGKARVDVFGVAQAIAISNSLNYKPRPVFQGYAAHTPALVGINSAYYRSARAPQYAFFKLGVIDSRLTTLEDAEVFLLLARDYLFVLEEKGYALLKRRITGSTNPITLRPVKKGKSAADRIIRVPNGVLWCQLEIRETWLGKLVSFLYQAPEIWVELESADRPLSRKRILLPLAAHGFLINPLPSSDAEFLQFLRGDYQGLGVSSIKVLSTPGRQWAMQPRINYQFSEIAPLTGVASR